MAHSWAFLCYSNIMETILGERRERETERRPEEKEKNHKSKVRN